MNLIKQLIKINESSFNVYQITAHASAMVYNAPHYFKEVKNGEDEFTAGPKNKELEDTLLEYWTTNPARQKDLTNNKITGVSTVKILEAKFSVSDFIADAAEEADDSNVTDFKSALNAARGICDMTYSLSFEVCLAGILTEEAAQWLGEQVCEAIWGQYADNGAGIDVEGGDHVLTRMHSDPAVNAMIKKKIQGK